MMFLGELREEGAVLRRTFAEHQNFDREREEARQYILQELSAERVAHAGRQTHHGTLRLAGPTELFLQRRFLRRFLV